MLRSDKRCTGPFAACAAAGLDGGRPISHGVARLSFVAKGNRPVDPRLAMADLIIFLLNRGFGQRAVGHYPTKIISCIACL
jgi:hypothetical protein